MKSMTAVILLGTTLSMPACSRPGPVANNAAAVNLPAPANVGAPRPEGGPPAGKTEATSRPAATAAVIPVALHGRWGLTPADCTSSRGDAKGLLVVTANGVNFYESRAVPSPGATTDSNSIVGNFAFAGEGQSWTKFETFERHKDMLVRTESNPAASYSYAKC
jgi:hypothetical protein